MKDLRIPAFAVLVFMLAACGGGDDGEGDGIQLIQPSVVMSGLPTGESISLKLGFGGETLTLNANGTFSFQTGVENSETYSVTIIAQPASTTCGFDAGGTSVVNSQVTSDRFRINCGDGTGGGGPVSTFVPPFKLYGWSRDYITGSAMGFPISVLGPEGNAMRGASASNFTFFDTELEVVNSPEFPIEVVPLDADNVLFEIAIALDVSESFSQAELETLKSTLIDFVNGLPSGYEVSVFTFDSTTTEQIAYTSDKAALVNAITAIPSDPATRITSTNLYGAINTAGSSIDYSLAFEQTLGYLIVITDGLHTANNAPPESTDDVVDDELVWGVVVGDDYIEEDFQTAIGPPEGVGKNIINAASVNDVDEALGEVSSRIGSLVSGLHWVLYRSPRRINPPNIYDFLIQASPLDGCAAISNSEDACGYIYLDYDPSAFTLPNTLFVVHNTINPVAGQTVVLRIPDWTHCSSSPVYQWNVNITGSGSSQPIEGGQAMEVQLGNTGPITVNYSVTDTAAAGGCTANGSINVP
jgi:hypothetical protein